ncbi:hypothetical protein GN244_ATG02575 [Phytophthora infestans]|uniref:Uncharacterized protein n=1 Tax=Phytophthora infestans TaxID=4787 RepID=A0A833TR92_PHYIN|nr:hypothetical protein GN244_ATG02575 [Phytophthora infestans]
MKRVRGCRILDAGGTAASVGPGCARSIWPLRVWAAGEVQRDARPQLCSARAPRLHADKCHKRGRVRGFSSSEDTLVEPVALSDVSVNKVAETIARLAVRVLYSDGRLSGIR